VIALTAESENDETAAELQESSEEGAQEALDESETAAVVYTGCSDLELREEAKELGISPGKLKLIRLLQTLDPDITVDEYKEAKVRDIFARANELLEASGSDFHQFGEYIGSMEGARNGEEEEEESSEQEESESDEESESESEDSSSKEEKEKEKNENQNSAAQQREEKQSSKAESRQEKNQEKEDKGSDDEDEDDDEEDEDEEEDEEDEDEESESSEDTESSANHQSGKGKNGK
jgi:hypothetical protein